MSSRPGVQITVRHVAEGGEHPNRYIGLVSAHVRVYWPPLADVQEIRSTLGEAYRTAFEEINKKYGITHDKEGQ